MIDIYVRLKRKISLYMWGGENDDQYIYIYICEALLYVNLYICEAG